METQDFFSLIFLENLCLISNEAKNNFLIKIVNRVILEMILKIFPFNLLLYDQIWIQLIKH